MNVEFLEDYETPVVLLSIKPKYAQRILSGYKKYELRTWIGLDIVPGMLVVMYVSGEVKAIVGEFRVGNIIKGRPDYIRKKIELSGGEKVTGVGEEDYSYISRAKKAFALEVTDVKKYKRPLHLNEIRNVIPGWNPPMSHALMGPGDPLWEMIVKVLREI